MFACHKIDNNKKRHPNAISKNTIRVLKEPNWLFLRQFFQKNTAIKDNAVCSMSGDYPA
jgi:hypothetical protein